MSSVSLINTNRNDNKLRNAAIGTAAVVAGLAVQAASELRDFICKYKSSDK